MASVGVDAELVESGVPVFVTFGRFGRVDGVNGSGGAVKVGVEMGLIFFLICLIGRMERFGFLEEWSFSVHQLVTRWK